ncbi:uncharacterized protein LOC120311711 [Crotalus tigris]|uniref:uncharacterized protein LOC120311711 n=1 Tax=Crotalus tigris TaxID=88082 RepID=UPI00192F4BE9|nr:uncharacterized protein LOC120311711 [Crotalus tigris]
MGILLHSVSGPQGFGWLEGHTGFKGTQLLPNLQEVQDAVPQIHSGQYHKRGFPLFFRPDRGIPLRPYPPTTPQIPPVLLRALALSVQGSTLWAFIGPSGIHKDIGSLGSPSQINSGACAMLPGWYNYPIQFFLFRPIRPSNNNQYSSGEWIFHEFQEESHNTFNSPLSPRSNNRLKSLQGLPLIGVQRQYQVICPQDTEREGGSTVPAVSAVGEDGFLSGDHSVGQTTFQSPPVISSSFSEKECECFLKEGESSTSHTVVSSVVDVVSNEQGIPIQGDFQTHLDYRCQPVQLGRPPTDSHGTRSMVPVRFIAQHQLAGTQSNPSGTPSIFHSCGGKTLSYTDGQHSSQGPCQQTRRDSVVALEALDLGLWAESNLESISVEHISGEANRQADSLSRATVDHSEWRLDPALFKEILIRFGQPQVDLFTSPTNSQLPRYFTRFPSPGVEGTDAVCSKWPKGLLYSFPPLPRYQ